MQIVHGAIKTGRKTIFVIVFRRMHCIKRKIHFVQMMLEHLMQKHDLPSFLSCSAGSVRNGWTGESSLAVQVSWGNTYMCGDHDSPSSRVFRASGAECSLLVGGSQVARVSPRLLKLGGGRRQVCPLEGEGLLRKMEEGICHLGGCVV